MKNLVVLDCESYPNYFLIAFKNVATGDVATFDIRKRDEGFTDSQIRAIKGILTRNETFGFNSLNYDLPVIHNALKGATPEQLFKMSDDIIQNDLRPWKTFEKYHLEFNSKFQHFDISEPTPGVKVGLKTYGGRIHTRTLQDLPYEVGSVLTTQQQDKVLEYCVNDLNITLELYLKVESQMNLRRGMIADYGYDVMSKSDAQLAEIIFKKELSLKGVSNFKAPVLDDSYTIKYSPPDYISFQTEPLIKVFNFIKNHEFVLDKNGAVVLPEELSDMGVVIGSTKYTIGIGGLHSCEKSQIVKADDNNFLIDKDVASYYPSIILNLGLYPKTLGKAFLEVYREIRQKRLEAKKNGDKTTDSVLKISLNGSYGKFGSKYSFLYSPDLMLTTTLTGQLCLLMLIEDLEENADVKVVSANTDGFVSLVPKHTKELYDIITKEWEISTGFSLEDTFYSGVFSRDVNNYLAVTTSGKTKTKGAFAEIGFSKNPTGEIIVDAVIAYLQNGTPLEDTLKACKDITKFVSVRKVTGGAVWNGAYLGKVVRWYYAVDGQPMYYKTNNNKVPKTDGSKPLMVLPDTIPDDINYSQYVNECISILQNIGEREKPKKEPKPRNKKEIVNKPEPKPRKKKVKQDELNSEKTDS
jgi:DNA polymerase elongation subunit (family B)